MDYVCAYVRLFTAHICHCTLIQLCSCSQVLHFVHACWVYFYLQMVYTMWHYRARVIYFLWSLILTLQVLILHPMQPGVTPRFSKMAAGRFAAFIRLLGCCDIHSGSLPFGVVVLNTFFPFWGLLHTAHGSLGWAALRPFTMLDLLGLFNP